MHSTIATHPVLPTSSNETPARPPIPPRRHSPARKTSTLCTANMYNGTTTAAVLSAAVLAAALVFGSQLPQQLATLACGMGSSILYFAWVGLYCLVSWAAVVTGRFGVLDVLGGRWGQVCGNKFAECRPWD
ncbi:hypothetical protein EJ07DRAFT_155709 [Lizonia empirigonia]|nr:hypothetical protein EJ07DRAFT_155709 [Lizonia empirigonia]